jgi:probable phosphoglycerate mutase
MPGVGLGKIGNAQAARLAERFARETVVAVQTSPLERARQTAEPIAKRVGRSVQENEGLVEIDFGAWTGTAFRDLERDPRWAAWNSARSVSRPPYGESMMEVQARVVGALETLRGLYREKAVVLVSHADVIRAVLLYHLGLPLDAYARVEVEPASVSTLAVGDWGAKLIRLNEVAAA